MQPPPIPNFLKSRPVNINTLLICATLLIVAIFGIKIDVKTPKEVEISVEVNHVFSTKYGTKIQIDQHHSGHCGTSGY